MEEYHSKTGGQRVPTETIKEKCGFQILSVLCATTKKMRYGDEDDRAECRRRKRIQKTAAKDSKFSKHPAANERTNQTENDVCDAAEAAAARQFSGKPPGEQAEKTTKPGFRAATIR